MFATSSSEAISSSPETTARTQRIADGGAADLAGVVARVADVRDQRADRRSAVPFAPGGVIAARTLPRFERSSGVTLNEAGSGL